jgi:hypothetical protein
MNQYLISESDRQEILAALEATGRDNYLAYGVRSLQPALAPATVKDCFTVDAPAVVGPVARKYICPVVTVADLANNLLLMDQALPIYGAQYIDHPTRGRCAIAVSPTVSRERVMDSRWIGQGDQLNAAVVWTRASQPAAPVAWPKLTAEEMAALMRFFETCEDGEGYDVPKPMMKRLAAIGVVNHTSGGIYNITEFGQAIIDAPPPPATKGSL